MREIYVRKRDGRVEKFSPEKVRRTLLKAGASRDVTERIIRELERRIYSGITTDEILSIVLDLLYRYETGSGARYDLKRSMFRLGPAGFEFEKFVARLLEEYGFRTRTNVIVEGECVEHEIDVIAEKDGKSYLIECKFHSFPAYTGLKEVMYTYARFLDVGRFDAVWLITNTKFSDEAKRYGECRGVRLTGWKYPEGEGIERMLERKNLYPVTLLRIEKETLDRLVNARVVFCRDVVASGVRGLKKIGLSEREARRVLKEAREILRNTS
ncbi:Restriction endonuclease/ATP cone domain [Geoglobus ahangari]|uniref:Restriction endonuclease/ATP cone domain n=1 Tax=Geoglobus ahangari TaxID=113653 RepID=A0A0F7IFI2_9EURY|nr:ATP cone domain-containing protein [Geoglobus ahangari]AKG91629.1 Restriction endonuclease/ATP cone domain [Geoglobus ahangari]